MRRLAIEETNKIFGPSRKAGAVYDYLTARNCISRGYIFYVTVHTLY